MSTLRGFRMVAYLGNTRRLGLFSDAVLNGLRLGIAIVFSPAFNLARILDGLKVGLPSSLSANSLDSGGLELPSIAEAQPGLSRRPAPSHRPISTKHDIGTSSHHGVSSSIANWSGKRKSE
jgi:hypothetical protein